MSILIYPRFRLWYPHFLLLLLLLSFPSTATATATTQTHTHTHTHTHREKERERPIGRGGQRSRNPHTRFDTRDTAGSDKNQYE